MRSNPKVLIVEDDVMIAEMTAELLGEHDFAVCGIAATGDEAMSLARSTSPGIALIDLRLANDERGAEVAARLEALGRIGILYTTGNAERAALEGASGEGCLIKPYTCGDLLRALAIVGELVATGESSLPFPTQFRRLPKRG
jgi:DNA-binding response OmpR family regulator